MQERKVRRVNLRQQRPYYYLRETICALCHKLDWCRMCPRRRRHKNVTYVPMLICSECARKRKLWGIDD